MPPKSKIVPRPTRAESVAAPDPAPQYVSEADFDDTIARNRAIPLLDPGAVASPPLAFRATDPTTRRRRLRKLSGDLRAEALEALREAGQNDLRGDLGKYAPERDRAHVVEERIRSSGRLVAKVQALLGYAREADQIALSDALVYLEAENKEYLHAVDNEPGLASKYVALESLFAARGGAIAEGMARSKEEAAAVAQAEEVGKKQAESAPALAEKETVTK